MAAVIMKDMFDFRSLLYLCPLAVLMAQNPPPQPVAPPPPTITTSVERVPAAPAVPPDRVVLSVGDVKITAAQFDQLVDGLPQQYQASARGAGRKQYADSLVRVLVMAQEGHRRKLDENPVYKLQTTFQNANLLAAKTFEQMNQELEVTDADLHKYYDEHAAEFEQVRARHILIRFKGSPVPVRPGQKDLTEEEALGKAQEIHKKLVAGATLATLASTESDDTGSGANGGQLGAFRHGQMVPSFEEAAFKLKPGELSEPVKSQFGYHLIQIDGHETKSFDEMKNEIQAKLKPATAQKAMQDMEKKATPVYDPEFFSLAKQ
jgi:peptidyl-prolyl cis-trans isomerase C